jgi:hypothetical protein
MVGSEFIFANGTSAGTITAFTNATSLTVSSSQTVSSQGYTINYPGLNVTSTGNVGIGITNPSTTLQVGGTLKASGTVTLSGFSTAGVVTNNASGVLATSSSLSTTYGGTGGTSAATGFSNLLGNPATGSYSINCTSGTSCATTTVVTAFTGDNTIFNNSSSTGAVTASLKNATAKSVLGNTSSSAAAPSYTTAPVVSGTMTANTFTSNVATGTAPLTVTSTTNVANLNASSPNGATFASPGAIGGGTAAAGTFTSLTASSTATLSGLSASAASSAVVCIKTNVLSTSSGGSACSNSSDIRIKRDVVTLPDDVGLDSIMKLRPVRFHWRDVADDNERGEQYGLIAQEVEAVFPAHGITFTGGDTTLDLGNGKKETVKAVHGVNYDRLVVPLIKAMQEIKGLVDGNHDELEQLKAANDNFAAQFKAANDNHAAALKAANDNIAELKKAFETYKAAHP